MKMTILKCRLRAKCCVGCATLVPALFGAGCAATTGRPAPFASSVEEWSEDGFNGRRYVTEHFEIVSTIRDAEFETALPGFLEAVHHRCAATLPPANSDTARLTACVFGNRAEWERFVRRRFPARYDVYSRIRSGGFTEGSTSVSFYVSRAGTLATLAHEAWHQYVGANVKSPMPAWLNEGLACLHESVRTAGRKFVFTPRENTFRINSLREAVQTDKLIPLARLIDTDAGEVISYGHSVTTQTYYAQAWALVTFLRYGENGSYARAFDRLLSDIADDTFRVRLSAASVTTAATPGVSAQSAVFEAYFGVRPEHLAEAYYDYLVRVAGF
jgi:hypothetical protein